MVAKRPPRAGVQVRRMPSATAGAKVTVMVWYIEATNPRARERAMSLA
jgi:hypothetical protein